MSLTSTIIILTFFWSRKLALLFILDGKVKLNLADELYSCETEIYEKGIRCKKRTVLILCFFPFSIKKNLYLLTGQCKVFLLRAQLVFFQGLMLTPWP